MAAFPLRDLPDWDDERNAFHMEEDGEAWKPNPTRAACKALYAQWRQVVFGLKGFLADWLDAPDGGSDEQRFLQHAAADYLGMAYEVAVKIRSSEAAPLFVVRMENAAIIRKSASAVYSGLLLFGVEEGGDESHIQALRTEIDSFRSLFRAWVATFERDEFEDEWGLF